MGGMLLIIRIALNLLLGFPLMLNSEVAPFLWTAKPDSWTAPDSVDNSRLLFELRRKSYERSTLHTRIQRRSGSPGN